MEPPFRKSQAHKALDGEFDGQILPAPFAGMVLVASIVFVMIVPALRIRT